MFIDLPPHIQKIVTQRLSERDFIKAKEIYDEYHNQYITHED